eukprot:CAMPEP_0195339000 /NCGR_PEP_ID=MMETSP0708-20121125/17929_1 /TAXON_ID=33640 /ORGANISM="Asterionellopsis glacialis, Strain CCMP134" /LENGTH=90 /DNA_ID=CAMNT_0040410499 /DNA_START=676 /DNA_END=948 /DNA_ORIENTATION=-
MANGGTGLLTIALAMTTAPVPTGMLPNTVAQSLNITPCWTLCAILQYNSVLDLGVSVAEFLSSSTQCHAVQDADIVTNGSSLTNHCHRNK